MNPFVFSCIVPHGFELIPELAGEHPELMGKTRGSLSKIGDLMKKANPECIIVLTPHGTRVDGHFSVSGSFRMEGFVEEHGHKFTMNRRVERELAQKIVEVSKAQNLPAASINYATSDGPFSCLPLDWGAIVPLRFMPEVPIVVITPSREVSFEQHVQFGNVLREVARKYGKMIGLVASCDWSHAHDEIGPYGFDPAAKQLDEEVVELIKNNELEKMSEFDADFIEAAKPDGIWQTLILAGAIPKEERKVEFLSYEAPTYFGLICAGYPEAEKK